MFSLKDQYKAQNERSVSLVRLKCEKMKCKIDMECELVVSVASKSSGGAENIVFPICFTTDVDF